MATVCLHIGAMKSGTSYLQHVLSANKDQLLEHGVHFPGKRWRDQVAAAADVTGIYPKGQKKSPGAWDALVDDVRAHQPSNVLISMETFAVADADAARRVVQSFPTHRPRVVITARDLGRVVPGQWQESIKNGATLDFDKFLAVISAPGARTLPGGRAFWGPQDIGRMLRTWQPFVGPTDLVLVTVPPSGAERTLLWHRFCEAAELPTFDANLAVGANESLGQSSVELMRQLNVKAKDRKLPFEVTRVLKHAVAKQILAGRADQETPLQVPDTYRAWASRAAEELVDDIKDVGPVVVGELAELLVPSWRDQSAGRLRTLRSRMPIGGASTTDDGVLDAAIDAILGMSQRLLIAQNKAKN